MAITVKPGFAHRFGHAVGAGVGRFLALEPRLAYTFRRRGLPPVLVKILFWSVKLAVIAALLYVAFWAAIFVAGLFILAALGDGMKGKGRSFFGQNQEEDKYQPAAVWRDGREGYGYYIGNLKYDDDAR